MLLGLEQGLEQRVELPLLAVGHGEGERADLEPLL
jgi:hypothetical protein